MHRTHGHDEREKSGGRGCYGRCKTRRPETCGQKTLVRTMVANLCLASTYSQCSAWKGTSNRCSCRSFRAGHSTRKPSITCAVLGTGTPRRPLVLPISPGGGLVA